MTVFEATSLPEGWRLARLSDLSQIVDCKHVTAEFHQVGFPVISIGELGDRYVSLEHAPRTSPEYFRLLTEGPRRLRPGDLIMSRNVTVGRVSRVHEDHPPLAMGQDVVLIRARSSLVLPRFLQQLIQSPVIERQLEEMMAGSTFMRVNVQEIKRLELALPETDEQARIAETLESAEDLIASLKRKITKKQAVKQGMMQLLLTGKARLSGSNSAWREAAISDVASVDPEALPSGTDPGTRMDYISLEDVNRGELVRSTELNFQEAPSRAKRVIRVGDVLFGTVRPNLQSHLLYSGGLRNPVASTGFAVIRAGADCDPAFLFFLIMSGLASLQINRIIAGSNYPAVTSDDVCRLTFEFPDIEEQQAISAALLDADREVVSLQERLQKARMMKVGMMQRLVTGATRLPVGLTHAETFSE